MESILSSSKKLYQSIKRYSYHKYNTHTSLISEPILNQIGKKITSNYNSDVHDNKVVFGAKPGRDLWSNSHFIFEEIIKNHTHIDANWIDKKGSSLAIDGNYVKKHWSPSGIKSLLDAKAIIVSHTKSNIAPHESFVGDDKYTIKVGHGTPLRGSKREAAPMDYDYRIAPSRYAAKLMQKRREIRGSYVITGYPRLDSLSDGTIPQSLHKKISSIEKIDHIFLYAPAKANIYNKDTRRKPVSFFPFPDYSPKEIIKFVEHNNIVLLLRPHPNDEKHLNSGYYLEKRKRINNLSEKTDNIVTIYPSNFPNTSNFLKIADVLITDLSGIFFDYLILDRPIIFTTYNKSQVDELHGLNFDYDNDLPGPQTETQQRFLDHISNYLSDGDISPRNREILKSKYYKHDDDHATERVVEFLKTEVLDIKQSNDYESKKYTYQIIPASEIL